MRVIVPLMQMDKENISYERHVPTVDSDKLNRAVERAAQDSGLVERATSLLRGLQFPAFKHNILDYARHSGADADIFALFESLNGTTKFRDLYHVSTALGQNIPGRRLENQITDKTRDNLDVRKRATTADASIKDREAVSLSEERSDYPEVTPTAMSNFVCDRCGKPFQNQNDLVQHQRFESGKTVNS